MLSLFFVCDRLFKQRLCSIRNHPEGEHMENYVTLLVNLLKRHEKSLINNL